MSLNNFLGQISKTVFLEKLAINAQFKKNQLGKYACVNM